MLVLSTTFFTCMAHTTISGDKHFQRWIHAATDQESRIFYKLEKIMKRNENVVDFSIGMAGTILFQYFFRLSSFDHVVGFLYFAVAWLANLTVLLTVVPSWSWSFQLFLEQCDCGVYSERVWCGEDYLACLCCFSTSLHFTVKLDLLCVVNIDDKKAVVSWRQNQTNEEIVWKPD